MLTVNDILNAVFAQSTRELRHNVNRMMDETEARHLHATQLRRQANAGPLEVHMLRAQANAFAPCQYCRRPPDTPAGQGQNCEGCGAHR